MAQPISFFGLLEDLMWGVSLLPAMGGSSPVSPLLFGLNLAVPCSLGC